jgi:hypothetical protein
VSLAEHDYMIEAFAPDRSDEPLSMAVLPGWASGNRTVADSHRTNAARVCWSECPVAVADQVPWRFVPGESLSHLSGDPFGARMSTPRVR